MAFCSNCGKEISNQAIACPQCGHPGPGHRSNPLAELGGPVIATTYASYGARVGAFLIDAVLILVILAIFAGIGIATSSAGPFFFVVMFGLASVVYKPLMEGSRGQTVGKMAVKIKVVRAADGGPIGYGEAFLRWLIGTVIGVVPFGTFADLLWPLWDKHMQTLHDKVATTIVVPAA